jgi:hypothetical protein
MDHIKVLKRAFEITWRYRALWIFGIILALTAGGGGGGGNSGYQFSGGNGGNGGGDWYSWQHPSDVPQEVVWTIVAIVAAVACVVLILIVAGTIARYVSETALIRMVDDHEETGEKRSIRRGFRLGWSRTAWRLFLINLLVDLPIMLAFLLLFLLIGGLVALAVWALLKWSVVVGVLGIITSSGLFVVILLALILVAIVLELLRPFFLRACALEEIGVIEAIRAGFQFVKRHFGDVAIMWLLMIGLGIAWFIVMIPVTILLLLAGIVVGGVPALTIGGLASLVFGGPGGWIAGGIVGVLIFIVVVAVPGLFLGGLAEVFKSSVWTLTYRELRALEGLAPKPGALLEADAVEL